MKYILALFLSLLSVSAFAQKSLDKKIDSVLATMTLEEKIGQMSQLNITTILQDSIVEDYGNMTRLVLDTNKLIGYIRDWHIGSFLNGRAMTPENWIEVTGTIQRINERYSDIPIIYGIDHMHGASYLKNGTIFPHNMNIGCTFDSVHAFNTARTAAMETADLGHNWIFGPVLGIGRAKSWGRFYETYSEDPLVVSKMGAAAVNGIQDSTATFPYKTAACAKHFIGYSDPKSGWDRSPAEIPDQSLYEFFLPPFKAAIDAGVLSVMINSGEINGIPVHASKEILTDLLRDELGFKGLAVSDWLDVIALEKMHYVAENEKEATYQAVMAGMDMSMIPLDISFCKYLLELVEEGRIPESRINESVRRVLWTKYKAGLFKNVMPRSDRLERINSEENIALARNAAKESIVLIKNEDDLLPLKNKKILLTGFTRDNKRALCGGWTYRFAADSDRWFPKEMKTIKDAFEEEFGLKNVTSTDGSDLEKLAKENDVIVIATGEAEAYAETDGTIDDLHLDQEQTELIKRAIATGKPVVLILTEGRPRLIPEVFNKVEAVVFAGLPGVYGAEAVAEIISGKVNPSGKMAFSYPKKSGHVIPYNHKRSEYSQLRPVSDELKRHAIAPFGHGLSYSKFEYSNLRMDTLLTSADQILEVTVDVKNTSERDGKEAVLWFVSDEYASITRPVKELVDFEKKTIPAGETQTYTLRLHPRRDLSFPDKEGNAHLEDGSFMVEVGNLSKRFWLKTDGKL